MIPPYAELHCVSNFSFLRAASHPEELVARAHALGYGLRGMLPRRAGCVAPYRPKQNYF